MAYVTSAQIVTRVGEPAAVQLTTDSGSTVDTDLIDAIIAEVEVDIDAVLQKRIGATITQGDYPKTFLWARGKAVDLVIFSLASRRKMVNDAWQKANDEALQALKDMAEGKINPPDADLNAPGPDWGAADQNAALADR